jgi:hypothetical protein
MFMSLARNVMLDYCRNVQQDEIFTHFVLIQLLPFYSLRDHSDKEERYVHVIVLRSA